VTDDPKKPPDTDEGWEQPAPDPIDPATGPSYPITGPSYPATGPLSPETGLAYPATEASDPATGPAYPTSGPSYPASGYSDSSDPATATGPSEPTLPPDAETGYVSYSSPAMDPVTGLPLEPAPDDAAGLPNPDDAPILPPTYDDASLRGDVPVPGAPPPKPPKRRDRDDDHDDDDDGDPRKGRRTVWIVAGSTIAGITIATLALLGRVNSSKYEIACDSDKIIAEQGRGFPPWGVSPLQGAEWKPITIAPNGECKPRETEDLDEFEGWYLGVLIDQASSLLTAREVTKPDVAAEQLNQALLLARSPDRRDQRKDIERLLGDVDYWRASAKLRDAATALADASKQFDSAAAQRPRHVSDAAAWASYLRKLLDQLHAGPAGGTQTTFPPLPPGVERPPAPPGVALPVEPADHGSDVPALAPPDAGAPSGGVLL